MRIAPRVEDLVNDLVASGRYADASEVIEEAVTLLNRRDHNYRIITSVQEARREIDQDVMP